MPHELLERLSREHGVRVIYAAERGSRGFGTADPSSDHDVLAVVASPPSRYWSLAGVPNAYGTAREGEVSVAILDIRRALSLCMRGTVEMHTLARSLGVLADPYGFREELRVLTRETFRPDGAVLQHANVMAEAVAAMRRRGDAPAKAWLHLLRPLLALMHVARTREPAPVPFDVLAAACADEALGRIALDLAARKRAGSREGLPEPEAQYVTERWREGVQTASRSGEPKRGWNPDHVAKADDLVGRMLVASDAAGPPSNSA